MLNGEPGSAKLATPPARGRTKPRPSLRRWAARATPRDELDVGPFDAFGEGGVAEQRCPLGHHLSTFSSRLLHCARDGRRREGPIAYASLTAAARVRSRGRPRASVGRMRVLITGGAGFVGSHVADRLAAEGHEPLLLDALLPQAHGDGPPPETRPARAGPRRRPRRRPAGPAAARGRRGVPPGGDGRARRRPRRRARVRRAQRPRHGRPARRDARRRTAPARAGRLDGRLRRGPLRLPGARRRPAGPRGAGRPRRGPVRAAAAPAAAATWSPGSSPRTRRSTRAARTPRPRLAQEYLVAAWARQTGGAAWSLRYHNVYGPRMPRDTPYAGRRVDLPVGAGAGRGAARPGGRAAAPRLRARHRRRRGQRPRADDRPARGRPHRGQRLLGRAAHDRRPGRRARRGDRRPRAGGRRRRPAGGRAPRRRGPGPGPVAAGVPGGGGLRRGSAGLRHRPAARARPGRSDVTER